MDPTPSTLLWTATGALIVFGIACAIAERRRGRRRNLDRPGLIPWQLLEILAFLLAFATATLAVRA
jgi:hypothetical protein